MGRRLHAAWLGLVLLGAPAAADDGLRCKGGLVGAGDSKVTVLEKCGDPVLQEVVGVERTGTSEVLVERWTYDLGPGRFLKLLTFEAGKLARVEDGERR